MPHQEDKKWEEELLEQTKRSWGFVVTESKHKLMMDDFESRKALIQKFFIPLSTVEELVEEIIQKWSKDGQSFTKGVLEDLAALKQNLISKQK